MSDNHVIAKIDDLMNVDSSPGNELILRPDRSVEKVEREKIERDDDRLRGPDQHMQIPVNPGEQVKKRRRLSEEETTKKDGKKTKKSAERVKKLDKKSIFIGDEHKIQSSESFTNKVQFTEVTKRERKPKEIIEEERKKKKRELEEKKRREKELEKERKRLKKAKKLEQLSPEFVREKTEEDSDSEISTNSTISTVATEDVDRELEVGRQRDRISRQLIDIQSGPIKGLPRPTRGKSWEQRLGEIAEELSDGGDPRYRDYCSEAGDGGVDARTMVERLFRSDANQGKDSNRDEEYSETGTQCEESVATTEYEEKRGEDEIPVTMLPSSTEIRWVRTIDHYLGFMGLDRKGNLHRIDFDKEFSFSAFGNSINLVTKEKGSCIQFRGGVVFYHPSVDIDERYTEYEQTISIIEHNTVARINNFSNKVLKSGMFLNAEHNKLYLYTFEHGDQLFLEICKRLDAINNTPFFPKSDRRELIKTLITKTT